MLSSINILLNIIGDGKIAILISISSLLIIAGVIIIREIHSNNRIKKQEQEIEEQNKKNEQEIAKKKEKINALIQQKIEEVFGEGAMRGNDWLSGNTFPIIRKEKNGYSFNYEKASGSIRFHMSAFVEIPEDLRIDEDIPETDLFMLGDNNQQKGASTSSIDRWNDFLNITKKFNPDV